MRKFQACLVVVVVLAAALLQGCADEKNKDQEGSGRIYVSNSGSLARFNSATTLQGDVVPTSYVRGSLTRLAYPGYLFYDSGNDRMYVPNGGDSSVLVFDTFSKAQENTPPTRFLSGVGTALSQPVQVQVDSTRDLLYVANAGNNSISVFSGATSLQGNVAPQRVLGGSSTQITGLTAFHVETDKDRLWVCDGASASILVYDSASTLNGNVPPTRFLRGGNTRLVNPQFLLFQGTRLYVSCSGSLLRFEGTDTLTGDVAPAALISGGDSALVQPRQLALNADKDELYVADGQGNAVWVFGSISSANGSPPPTRRLTGGNTGFSGLTGLILDLTVRE